MSREDFIAGLEKLIGDFLRQQGYEPVELVYRYEGRDLFLRVIADRPEGGITLEECSSLNKQIGAVLDEKNLLDSGYILEVSSPGLDRPLKTKEDFLRCLNRKARLFLSQPLNGKMEIEGLLKGVAGDNLIVDLGGENIEVHLNKINMAKQMIGE